MKSWEDIHVDFTEELQKSWEEKGFTAEQTKEWIDAGLNPIDAKYVHWLRDVKQKDAEWVLNHGNDKELREEYVEKQNKFVEENTGFCCEHAKKAQELIQNAYSLMMGESKNETSEGGKVVRTILPWFSNYDKVYLTEAIKDYKKWMVTTKDCIRQAEREMNACNCSREKIAEMKKESSGTVKININLREMLKDKQDSVEREKSLHDKESEKLEKTEEELKNKINELIETSKELGSSRIKEQKLADENNYLKKQVEELRKCKLLSQEERLQRLILRRGADEEEIKKLRKAYEKLEQLSEKDQWDEVRNNIETVETNIRNKFVVTNIGLEEIQEIFALCKEVAELRVQVEQIHFQKQEEKLESFMEVPPHSNTK